MNKKQKVALSSVFASAGLTFMKLVVGILSGSMGVLSEAAHSALDFGAAVLTFFAVSVSDKPADDDHHYGHGKTESVSALIETGLLFVTSGWIIYESIHRLLSGKNEIETTWYTFAVVLISILIDVSRSRALSKTAKETNSQALEADALHFSSDILSSLVVLIGLVLVGFGINSADVIAAIGVSLFVAHAGYKLGKRTIDVLTDAAPIGLREEIIQIIRKSKEIIDIEKVRVRTIGPDTFIDMTVYVSRQLPLLKTQKITENVCKNIREKIPQSDIVVHIKPLPIDSETIEERVKIAASTHHLQVHDIALHYENKKKYLSYDLEMDKNLTLEKAHQITTHLEKTIKQEIGEDIEINSHIEPLRSEAIHGKRLSLNEEEMLKTRITQLVDQEKNVKNIHNIKFLKTRSKIFLSLHCSLSGNTSLEKAHDTASNLEYTFRKNMPEIERVVVHTEPHFERKNGCHK